MEESNRLFDLFQEYYNGSASTEKIDELMQLMLEIPDESLAKLLEQTWIKQGSAKNFFSADVREKIMRKLPESEPAIKNYRIGSGMGRKMFLRVAAAAAILLLVLSTTVFILLTRKSISPVAQQTKKNRIVNDVEPGGDKAVLTLADGKRVILDTAGNGALTVQGGIKVIKLNGQIVYAPQEGQKEVLYNTITTPRGGQYQLVLADGTKVWLNAESSLRFPTSFAGNERKVELTGEGYFEVAHNEKMPFRVMANDVDVKVLGTHFNINSYRDETAVRTTLVEGRVEIKTNDSHVFLNPGQQGIIENGDDKIKVDYDVDVEEVVAWKNGLFKFNGANLESIMRQAERWYNVEVVYEGKTNETFTGGLQRSENISQLLKVLEATGKVDFIINGRQIIVKPK
jgi:transmembrane sensor